MLVRLKYTVYPIQTGYTRDEILRGNTQLLRIFQLEQKLLV